MMEPSDDQQSPLPAPSLPPTGLVLSPDAPQHLSARSATIDTAMESTTSKVPTYLDTHQLAPHTSHAKQHKADPNRDPWVVSEPRDPLQRPQKPLDDSLHSQHQEQQDNDRASLLPQLDGPASQRDDTLPTELPHGHHPAPSSDPHEIVLLSSHASSHAPSYSDLFFDLLFAACLNTYSNAVSLEKFANVAAFLGYFAALWWAWWSQAYFDVRYRRPSHHPPFLFKSSQRIVRAAVLGLWVAFSTTPSEFSRGSFTNFTMIYGCSRMALALDHAVVLIYDLVHWKKSHSVLSNERETKSPSSHAEEPCQLASRHVLALRRDGRRDDMAIVIRTHLVSIVSLVASGLLWILSRLVRHNGVTAPLLVMWILGVLIEAAAQILNELSGVLLPLGNSVLPERLVLFGLIILGEGFTGIAETLNKISPGAKLRNEALGGEAIESGGWGGDTILQAVSCVLIVILQFGGYFHRATSQIDMASVFIVFWAYIHMLLHMSSALLVIGLKKILSFQNTLNALTRFFDDPTIYLPNTSPWKDLTPDQVSQPYNDGDGTSPLSTNGTLAGVSAIISVIQSNDGANIPSLSEAQRLVASVVGLAGGTNESERLVAQVNASDASNALSSQFAPSLVLPFKTYFEFADNVVNPDSINQYIVKSLFQFKYIYVASAAYLTVDIFIKTMQSRRERQLRSFRWAMALRFGFAMVLILLQVIFTVFQGAPSDAALDGALAICAAVLLAELVSQQIVDGLRGRLDRARPPAAQTSRLHWSRFGRSSQRPSRSSQSASLSDKAGDEDIEMESHIRHTDSRDQAGH